MATPYWNFLICDNPLGIYQSHFVTSIYHESKPRFMASLFRIDPENFVELTLNGINYPFMYVRGDGYQQMFVLIIWDMRDRSTTTKFSQLLKLAAAWYTQCLNKVNEKVYGISSWRTMSDYHYSMPGIQVLQVKSPGPLLVFYHAGVRTFSTDEDVRIFLETKLNYPDTEGLEVGINML